VVLALVQTILDNRAFLSEVDGKIGDGDHGINMAKGFLLIKDRLGDREVSMSEGLGLVGKTLRTEIGGSMGPIYGTFFIQMSLKAKDKAETDAPLFGQMLKAAREGLHDLGGAQVVDKTLMDTVVPAQEAYQAAVDSGASMQDALKKMADAAEKGKDSTVNLVAKIGRSARLGERRAVCWTRELLRLHSFCRHLPKFSRNRRGVNIAGAYPGGIECYRGRIRRAYYFPQCRRCLSKLVLPPDGNGRRLTRDTKLHQSSRPSTALLEFKRVAVIYGEWLPSCNLLWLPWRGTL
jgi:dihydroxyacetone kinase-like protein